MSIEITAWPALAAAVGAVYVLGVLAGLRLGDRQARRARHVVARLRREVADARRREIQRTPRPPDSIDLLDDGD